MTVVAQKQLAEQALALPPKARARLALLLVKSLDVPGEEITQKEWAKAWAIELEKKVEEVRSGRVKTVPAHRVMAELKAKYG
jgi:putative addiction module component (TIGR02574 family)